MSLEQRTPASPGEIVRDDLHELNTRLKDFLSSIEELEGSKLVLEGALSREQHSQSSRLKELKERAEREQESLRIFCEQLKQQLDSANRHHRQDVDRLRQEAGELIISHQAALQKQKEDLESQYQMQVDSVRVQAEAMADRTISRLNAALQKTEQQLQLALEELDRYKKGEAGHDLTRLAAELAKAQSANAALRDDNRDLQLQLVEANERLARFQEDKSLVISKLQTDCQNYMNSALDAQAQLDTLHASYEKEVRFYRKILDEGVTRITPSKSIMKKRKFDEDDESQSPGQTSSTILTRSHTHTTPSRRTSMELVMDERSTKLEVGTGDMRIVGVERETVTIRNKGSSDVQLAGWSLVAEKAKKEFRFARKVLKAGTSITVLSGPDNASRQSSLKTDEIWWSDKKMWGQRNENAILFTPDGHKVSTFTC